MSTESLVSRGNYTPDDLIAKRIQHNNDKIILRPIQIGKEIITVISPDSLPSSSTDLKTLRIPGSGIEASKGRLYRSAIFFRDGSAVANDTMNSKLEIAKEIVSVAIDSQGKIFNPVNEEEPGKFPHEIRTRGFIRNLQREYAKENRRRRKNLRKMKKQHADQEIIAAKVEEHIAASEDAKSTIKLSKKTFRWLSEKFGGDNEHVTFYGAADTTPSIVNLIASIYNKEPPKQQERERTSVKEAMGYIIGNLTASDLGLLEYQHKNPKGIQNQYFKDSFTSLIFSDPKKHPNFHAPIAEIGIQGITHDALKTSQKLLTKDEIQKICSEDQLKKMFDKEEVKKVFKPSEIAELLEQVARHDTVTTFDVLAKIIKRQVIARYWMDKEQYFASALDRDPDTAAVRVIDGIQSNPASLLNTSIFDDLTDIEQEKYVGGIAWTITGPEFLTQAGHRGRALRHKDALKDPFTDEVFDDYHGVKVTWPNEVKVTADGLARWKIKDTAEQLYIRITNHANIEGSHKEFGYVDEKGDLLIHRLETLPEEHEKIVVFNNSNHSESPQAMAVSADYAVKKARNKTKKDAETVDPNSWQYKLDQKIIARMKQQEKIQTVYKTRMEIEEVRQKSGYYYVNKEKGETIDTEIRKNWGYPPWF